MRKILLTLLLLASTACAAKHTEGAQAQSDSTSNIDIDADIGEMLLVGFRGTSVDSTMHIWRDLTHFHVGAVILFDYDAELGKRGRNINNKEQVAALCRQLRSIRPDLLISIDQEGGQVCRLKRSYGFEAVASAKRSAAGGEDSVRACAARTAEMLREVGINLNFAPVADVDINPKCPVIGAIGRSFGSDPQQVARMCQIWIEEQERQGVASCMKHFPGHGSASGDTHKGLVDVSSTWQRKELEPYRELCNKVPMVMTAHVVNRQIDAEGLPASLSARITSLLRDSIGFRGVIVTDDLAMGAIVSHYSFERAVQMAVEAGADMLCLSNNGSHYDTEQVPRAVKAIKEMIETKQISAERIHRSAERVRVLKKAIASDER